MIISSWETNSLQFTFFYITSLLVPAAAADSAAADAASAAAAADQYEDCHIVIADSSIAIKVRRNRRLWQRERQGLSRVWWLPLRIADGAGGISKAGGGDHAFTTFRATTFPSGRGAHEPFLPVLGLG